MKDKTYLAALIRKGPSAPGKWLVAHGKVHCGPGTLDYGCGHGEDAECFKWDRYDPRYYPAQTTKKYNFITCIYVLNVLTPKVQKDVIEKVKNLLAPTGVAYFVVRRDFKKDKLSPRGYKQRFVVLDYPVARNGQTYCIYEVRRDKR
jgi:hypothetical protein